MKLFGIDISSYQNGINMNTMKNNGVQFAILRAGFTGWGTGVNYNKDKCFEDFYNQCKNAGVNVGAYWYSCANTRDKGIAEAKFMYDNCLKGKQFEYPIYIDVEDSHWQKGNKTGVTEAIKGFCEYLENLGYYVGIYASDISGFKEMMDIEQLKGYDKWVARYGSEPKYMTNYQMWQYASTARVSGFNENLDGNYVYVDYPTTIKNGGFNGYSKGNNNPTPTPVKKSNDEIAKEVLEGKWGNGEDRKNKLTNAGYNYSDVQAIVNKLCEKPKVQYLNISPNATYRSVYSDSTILKKIGEIKPQKFGGLTYKILGTYPNEVVKIHTATYGDVYISGKSKYCGTITNNPVYKNGSY